MTRFLFSLILTFILTGYLPAQGVATLPNDSIRLENIKKKLADLSALDPEYQKEIDLSAGKMTLADMLRTMAKVSKVNLTVKGTDNIMVTCNFSRARITDVLYFLSREYQLDLDVIGNIVSIYPKQKIPEQPKEPEISYHETRQSLSYDLNGESLIDITKKINYLTKINVIIPKSLYPYKIFGYAEDLPFDDAIHTLCEINDLEVEKSKSGVWNVIDLSPSPTLKDQVQAPAFSRRRRFADNQLSIDSTGRITAQIGRGVIQDIITDLCEQQSLNHFFMTPVNQQTSVYVRDVSFETLLNVLLSGTTYTYYRENGIYIFGNTSKENTLSAVQVIPLTYRSVDKVDEIIPAGLKEGLQIQKFPDLNSLIVCGDQKDVSRIESFLVSIDKRVPLVSIEIIIMDAIKSNLNETGIEYGIGTAPAITSGTLSPGVDMTLNASSVNRLINSFNGFGSVNLGKVNPNFYMNLKFLEENGVVKLRSTPKLSTLNGHEATLKSGETKYYKEIQYNMYGTQNPVQSESYVWKSVEANLNIKITPYVSQDEQITLNIEIEQSEFTEREVADSPPGITTRSFKSLIKVQNEEMVLLGGIDKNNEEQSATGLPYIARIPVLKWLFGKRKNNVVEQKLNVFIKPTVFQ